MAHNNNVKVILVALNKILPDSVIIHQDPQELVPIHPVHQVQDWDAPKAPSLGTETGEIPPDHRSHDHLNEQKEVLVDQNTRQRWINHFQSLKKEERQIRATQTTNYMGLVDGFLLYWHKDVIDQLDIRIMLRVPHDVLKQRRHERHGYHTAVQSNAEGTLWRDPPQYWENIVYPAYVDAHKDIFLDGDVEQGTPGSKVEGLVLLESLNVTMSDAIDRCCIVLSETMKRS
ncbi:hypothetical protein BDQ17DRAFT_1365672 [Cyathus striatus]|nr:hypothetical protein BDQ17DRAFT_1365672 [Cyathus striatus]